MKTLQALSAGTDLPKRWPWSGSPASGLPGSGPSSCVSLTCSASLARRGWQLPWGSGSGPHCRGASWPCPPRSLWSVPGGAPWHTWSTALSLGLGCRCCFCLIPVSVQHTLDLPAQTPQLLPVFPCGGASWPRPRWWWSALLLALLGGCRLVESCPVTPSWPLPPPQALSPQRASSFLLLTCLSFC